MAQAFPLASPILQTALEKPEFRAVTVCHPPLSPMEAITMSFGLLVETLQDGELLVPRAEQGSRTLGSKTLLVSAPEIAYATHEILALGFPTCQQVMESAESVLGAMA